MQNAELLWSLVIRLGLGNWVNEVLLRVIILKKLTWKLIQSFSQPSPQAFSARSFLDSTMSCDVTERSKLLNFRVIRRSAKYPCRFPTLSYIISLIDMSHHGEYHPPPPDPRGQYHHWHDRIFLIWQAPAGYEEFAVGIKPIRNGEIFWMNQ